MFKCRLLATTAFVVVGSLSFAAAQPQALAHGQAANIAAALNRDSNFEFLSNYGQFSVTASRYASSEVSYSTWTHVAVPVVGHGKTVDNIIVKEKSEYYPSYCGHFSAGIYSNTASGLPGKRITGGTGMAHKTWRSVAIPITPINLMSKTKYWVVETAPWKQCSYIGNAVNWKADPFTRSRAYVQTHYYHQSNLSSSSYTSPWKLQSAGPWFRLR